MRAEAPKLEALEGEAEDDDIWVDAPPADQQQRFTNSPPEEEAILQEWCSQDHVSLPTDTLNVSDGSIKPLSPQEGEGASRPHHLRTCEEKQLMQGMPSVRRAQEGMLTKQHM